MAGHRVVIERPLTEAQSVFDELTENRRDLNGRAKVRREALENIPKYNELTDDMKEAREERKGVIATFDSCEPSHKRGMETVKDKIDALSAKLTGIALEHFKKTGSVLELVKRNKNGKEKKIRIGFAFRQLSLF